MASKSPEDKVEQFLAAPEEVVKNKRELQKLIERRALDRARIAREGWNKRKTPATLEDILEDVIRVAEDKESNPAHYKFRSISRRRYELFGEIPIEQVLKYGQFQHIKQMAKLVPSRGDQRLLLARTMDSRQQHDQRYFDRYVAPYIGRFPEIQRETVKGKLVVWISDSHSFFMDPFTWLAFLAFIDDAQPDVIVWGGDHIDGSEISTHNKPPGFSTPLQMELDLFRAQAEEVYGICPLTKQVWVASNHWTDRIVRHMTQTDPALSGLRSMRIDKQINLEHLPIELVHGGSFLSPPGQEDKLPRAVLFNRLHVSHGTKTGKFPAMAELYDWAQLGTPKGKHAHGITGHVHRFQQVTGPHAGLRLLGHTCSHSSVIEEVAKYYVRGAGPAWTRGFVIAEMGAKAINVTGADCTLGEVFANGWHYVKKGRLPTGVADVKKFWMKRYAPQFKTYAAE